MLRLVLGADEDVSPRWQALQPLDLNELDPGSFCLLPLLHTRLSGAGVADPLSERVAGTFRSTWYRTQLSLRRFAGISAELSARSVEHLVVGGASVASRFYPQVGLRPLPQLDLAVAPEGANAARRIVEQSAEWRSRIDRPEWSRFEDAERFVVVVHVGPPVFGSGTSRAGTALRTLLARGATAEVDAAELPVLAPADELVLACGLGARATSPPSVQWLLDVAFVARASSLSAQAAAAAANEFALVATSRATIRYLENVVDDVAISALAQALEPLRPGRRDRLAFRLGARGDALSQGVAAHVRRSAAQPLGTALRELPVELLRVDAAGWARRALSAARR